MLQWSCYSPDGQNNVSEQIIQVWTWNFWDCLPVYKDLKHACWKRNSEHRCKYQIINKKAIQEVDNFSVHQQHPDGQVFEKLSLPSFGSANHVGETQFAVNKMWHSENVQMTIADQSYKNRLHPKERIKSVKDTQPYLHSSLLDT